MIDKLFEGLRGDTRHAFLDMDTMLVMDDELGLCRVDLRKRPSEQYLQPVDPHAPAMCAWDDLV